MLTHECIVSALKQAAKEFPILKAYYFGSYANGSATEESDLDLLVEFDRSTERISILTVISLKQYLEEVLGKSVDVVSTPIPKGAIIEIDRTVGII